MPSAFLNVQSSTLNTALDFPVSILRGLRVCFIAGTLGQGGAERQLVYALNCLKENGAEVSLITLAQGEFWEERIRELGVAIYFVGSHGSRLKRLMRVARIVRHRHPRVIQCQHFYTNIYGSLAGRCLGIPSVGAVRSDGFRELKSNGRLLGRLSLRLPHWITVNSDQAISNLRTLGLPPEKYIMIPNVVDTKRFRPGSIGSAAEFVILGVGSLERVKRFDRLLKIAAGLRARTTLAIRVIIAGDGRERSAIEAKAAPVRQTGVNVDLVGRVSDAQGYYQSANVLVLTSETEGTPNVIMEAMACGLPAVATRVGGVPDLIRNGETGFLFDPDKVEDAVDSLVRLAGSPDLAAHIGRRARTFIEENHSLNLLPGLLARLYEAVLAKNRS